MMAIESHEVSLTCAKTVLNQREVLSFLASLGSRGLRFRDYEFDREWWHRPAWVTQQGDGVAT